MALRPQPGQGEAARNILSWAAGSDILRVPLNMAHLGSARRNLADVRAALAGSPSPAVAAVLPGVNQLDATLARLAKDPVALLTRPALEAEEMRREFRALLAEVKRGLTEQYRALLNVEAHLPPEAIAVFDLMTSAIHHLEQAAPRMPRVQDDYSLRCAPQVLGAVRATLEHARRVIVAELNAVVDNPIIFPPPADEAMPLAEYAAMIRSLGVAPLRRLVVGGGNFHGEPLGLAMDSLTAALSEAASISERRTASMVDKGHSNGLPSFLIHESGLNCGFMILQYTAAALVSENKTLCYPATVDSIPTCENTEDHVSMGGIAARKCREVLENAEMVVAIEILAAWQAIHFRAPLRPGAGARRVADILRERGIAFYSADRVPYPDIEEVTRLLRAGALTAER
ncbi:MAG: aromatic amino acid lyase [Planctomycetes bacterium]|nr:aromatic amino acid lyase [Planctomycetota bacterium]